MGAKTRTKSAAKLDLHKLHREEYAPAREPIILHVRDGHYLAIEGRGEPGGRDFQDKLGALYGMAFTIKMTRKRAGLGDYVVAGLEGQYWPDPGVSPLEGPLETMNWRLMIRTPEALKGCPNESSPPLGLTGHLPPSAGPPDRRKSTPSPVLQSPRSS